MPGSVAQSVMFLTADPGVESLILARSHTFMSLILAGSHTSVEIDHAMLIFLPSSDSRRVVTRECM